MEEMQNVKAQAPVVEEQVFSGALFGFKRKEVLEYIRRMSAQNDEYARSLDASMQGLHTELDASRIAQRELDARAQELSRRLQEADTANEKLNTDYLHALQESREYKEKLFGREQKCVMLQKECTELHQKNSEINAQVEKARALLDRYQAHVAEQAQARRQEIDQLNAQHAAELEEVRRCAEAETKKLEDTGSTYLGRVEQEARQTISTIGKETDERMEKLYRGVEQMHTELAGLKTEMESVQRQINAAHAMVLQTSRDLSDTLKKARSAEIQGSHVKVAETPDTPAGSEAEKGTAAQTGKLSAADVLPGQFAVGLKKPISAETPAAKTVPASERSAPVARSFPGGRERAAAPEGHGPAAGPKRTVVRATGARETAAEHLVDCLTRLLGRR